MNPVVNVIIWLIPLGCVVQLLRGLWAYRACRKAVGDHPYWFKWDVLHGPRWSLAHPASGRYCHICGADAAKEEPCDAGLHS